MEYTITLERILKAAENILDGYDDVTFVQSDYVWYVHVEDYHAFDSLNDYFTALCVGEVEETGFDEFDGVYVGKLILRDNEDKDE